ncbi:MAG: hypothetical protein IKT90_06030 [Clostridia bacterium]|nr:hypothetical protein [Clostridia bacterium]
MRHIDIRFIDDLLRGELSYFLAQVQNNRKALSLEIRDGYINIYYKGGNLLKITQKRAGYNFHFDARYCKHADGDAHFSVLNRLPRDDRAAYQAQFPLMMQEMDRWFAEHPKPERDYQHQLLVNNPEIVDIEYQVGRRMRLDMLLVSNNKLLVVENKYGTGAIGGSAGLSKHYADICSVLQDPAWLEELLDSVCHISQAKFALGLRDTVIQRADIRTAEVLFLLANYNPNSQSLHNEMQLLNGTVPASLLLMTTDHAAIHLDQAKPLFPAANTKQI